MPKSWEPRNDGDNRTTSSKNIPKIPSWKYEKTKSLHVYLLGARNMIRLLMAEFSASHRLYRDFHAGLSQQQREVPHYADRRLPVREDPRDLLGVYHLQLQPRSVARFRWDFLGLRNSSAPFHGYGKTIDEKHM